MSVLRPYHGTHRAQIAPVLKSCAELSLTLLRMLQAGVKPNVRTYTALIAALGAAKQWERALATLRSLGDDSSAGRVEPNAYTYSALLKAWASTGSGRSRSRCGAELGSACA